jgi:pilus assembly protein CpaB
MGAPETVKGKSGGAFGFAFVALLCAGAAALVAVQMTRGFKKEKKLPVVVAKRAISAAETITPEMVQVAMWPDKQVPEGALSSLKTLFAEGNKPVASTGILANEAIVTARLADPSKGTALAALVRPGYRAVAVKMENNVVRAGLLYPGAQVDVVGTLRTSAGGATASRILVVNVRVLAVEAHTDVETFKPKEHSKQRKSEANARDAVVTVELTPEQAELVFLAERVGHVDLALRNGDDDLEVTTPGATPDMILEAQKWQPPEATPPPNPGARPTPVKAADNQGRAGRRRPQVHRSAAEAIASDKPSAAPATIETYNAKKH